MQHLPGMVEYYQFFEILDKFFNWEMIWRFHGAVEGHLLPDRFDRTFDISNATTVDT